MERVKNKSFILVPLIVALIFFAIPFFWFKPGEMDLGGDNSRLYYYNPVLYLTNHTFYSVSASGFGNEVIGFWALPFVLLLYLLKSFLVSSTTVISFYHGLNLSLGFFAAYLIVRELLKKKAEVLSIKSNFVSLTAGLTYILLAGKIMGWDKVLTTHDQVFLNPLVFYLLLRYFRTSNLFYLIGTLVVTLLFSHNFSFAAAPPFFAFYPLSTVFLLIYRSRVLKIKIIWRHIIFAFIAFLGLESFHLLPNLANLFSPGSALFTAAFTPAGIIDRGLNYFTGIANSIKVSINIMNFPDLVVTPSIILFLLIPAITIIGLIMNGKEKIFQKSTMLLVSVFFFISFFFATANITNLGFWFYKSLFIIPGFSMFRNYFGHWGPVLLFYYTLLFGLSLDRVITVLSQKKSAVLISSLIILSVMDATPFIRGDYTNKDLWQTKGIKLTIRMDPQYEKLLTFIPSLPKTAIVLTLPQTDHGYQIVAGKDGGAYQGPSTISYLGGKQDFSGFSELGRFSDYLYVSIKKQDLETFKSTLGMMNIGYLFYNADPAIYDLFPGFPYSYTREFFPDNQEGYKQLVNNLSLKEINNINNRFFVYELDKNYYYPRIFIPSSENYFSLPINDWRIPLSQKNDQDQLPVFFEGLNKPISADKFQFVARPDSKFMSVVKNPDPSRLLHNAFATQVPGSIFYPLILMRENIDLNMHKLDNRYLVDRRMFLSAKRIFELVRWNNQIAVQGDVKSIDQLRKINASIKNSLSNIRIWRWFTTNKTNTWESLLARYLSYFEDNLTAINQSNESQEWKIQQLFLMNEYFYQHEQRLINLLESNTISSGNKNYLINLITNIFNHLRSEITFDVGDISQIRYELDLTNGGKYIYQPMIFRKSLKSNDHKGLVIEIDGLKSYPLSEQTDPNWILFDKMDLSNFAEQKKYIYLHSLTNPENLFTHAAPLSADSTENSMGITTFSLDTSSISDKRGPAWQINNWNDESYYLLSFSYKTKGAPFKLTVTQKEIDLDGKTKLASVSDDLLSSDDWTLYQSVIKSNRFFNKSYFQFTGLPLEPGKSKLDIKNISLVQIVHPYIQFQQISAAANLVSPDVKFKKINPTKYLVEVKNVAGPYYLVLNQSYHDRWHVYKESSEKEKIPIWGKLKYQIQSLLSFDSLFFETLFNKPLPFQHLAANGYANAWFIKPEDMDNLKSYDLIIEMKTQKYFYLGLGISFITIVLIVGYSLYHLGKHET